MKQFVNIEFYNTPEGDVMLKEEGKAARLFEETDYEIVAWLLAIIRDRYPNAHAALMELYSKSNRNKSFYEYKVAHRFARCNFGEYDQNKYDIDYLGRLQFEEVKCPLRGACIFEGVICKPKLSTKLSEREIEVFRLIANHLTAEDIASELSISILTVNRHRENIKAKIGARNVGEMISYWHANNLQ